MDCICAVCGIALIDNLPYFDHIVPKSENGESLRENAISLCAACHDAKNLQPTEMEFTHFLAGILQNNQSYTDIQLERILGKETRFRADITATRLRGKDRTKLLIECKSARFASSGRISDVIAQLNTYKSLYGDCQAVLAIPATLDEGEMRALEAEQIELWDLDYLSSTFALQLKSAPHGYLRLQLLARVKRGNTKTKESLLLESLRKCEPGKRDWNVYQTLVGDILEVLFCPPLTKPFSEHSDQSMSNRRDFIVPNYAEDGFWAFLRKKYMADYLVVDAKNYTRKIKKAEILQVANYLKPQGAGLFGMIFSRRGGDLAGCMHTLREQWLIHQKMILVFDDSDVESMLRAKEDGRTAEELVGKKIEGFRLSM